jgi:type IV pilus assembly protein PilB
MLQVDEKGIEDVLAEQGKLTKEQVSTVKMEAINSGKTAEQILLTRNLASQEDISRARGVQLGFEFINPSSKPVPADVLSKIPEPVARRFVLIPFKFEPATNTLSVAMSDPLDLQVIEFIERKSAARIKSYISTPELINQAIAEQYSQSLTTQVSAALEEVSGTVEAKEELTDLGKVEEVIKEAPVAKIVSTLLEYAMKSRASDVHIEPQEDRTRVRYRIDGILQERVVLPRKVHEALVSRIKILAVLKIDEKRIPQDGRFTFKLKNEVVDLRVASLPTVNGEKVVMRLLPKAASAPTLPELGLRGNALKTFEENIKKPNGIILITGPTGSGKTTTLFSALSKISSPKVNIITLEDPVEYQIPGVNQVQINIGAGLTFASGLRSFLRQDPNIIMVGEVRDGETAGLAIQASLTGHLVFSTLHTNSSAGALPRLLDMGAETFLLASTMNCIVAQRVVRKICPECKESFTPPVQMVDDIKKTLGNLLHEKHLKLSEEEEKDLEKFGGGSKLKLSKGKGCDKCGDSGYKGRVAIFEVMPVNEKVGRLILERSPAGKIEEQAVEDGMVKLIQDGFLKVIEGTTTFEEIMRVAKE